MRISATAGWLFISIDILSTYNYSLACYKLCLISNMFIVNICIDRAHILKVKKR